MQSTWLTDELSPFLACSLGQTNCTQMSVGQPRRTGFFVTIYQLCVISDMEVNVVKKVLLLRLLIKKKEQTCAGNLMIFKLNLLRH